MQVPVHRWFFLCIVFGWSLSARSQSSEGCAKDLVLKNDAVRLRFGGPGMGLKEMRDMKGGVDHLAPNVDTLWSLEFGRGTQREIVDNQHARCTGANVTALSDGTQIAEIEWKNIVWYKEPNALSVRVRVELPAHDGIALWQIWVDNRSDYWGLWNTRFPVVQVAHIGRYDLAQPAFASGGRLISQAVDPVRGLYPSGSWPLQFMTMSMGENGLLLSAEDPSASPKQFDYNRKPGEVALTHFPEGMGVAGSKFLSPYPLRFGVFQGGWAEGASRYARWAGRQSWATASDVRMQTETERKLKEIRFWIVYDFPMNDPETVTPDHLLNALEELRTQLGVPVGVHWYRWNTAAFDNLYPHFLPARKGTAALYRALKEHGFVVMPYVNGSSTDLNIPDFTMYASDAVKDEAGGFRMHRYLDSSGRLLTMCPSSKHWQDEVKHMTGEIKGIMALNAIYIDQVSAVAPSFCFDPSHNHPLGGGSWWTSSTRSLARGIRDNMQAEGNKPTAVISETPNEPYIDLLDGSLTWNNMNGTEIPLFQRVYAGHTVLLGSPTEPGISANLYRRTQSTALMDGRELGWVGLKEVSSEHPDRLKYLRSILAIGQQAAPYLRDGHLIGTFNSGAAGLTFPDQIVKRTDVLKAPDGQTSSTFPIVEGRVWQGLDGRLAILLANATDEPVDFSLAIDFKTLGLQVNSFRLLDKTGGMNRKAGGLASNEVRQERLAPQEMRFYEEER